MFLVNTTPTGENDYYDDTDEDDYEEEYSSENSTANGQLALIVNQKNIH